MSRGLGRSIATGAGVLLVLASPSPAATVLVRPSPDADYFGDVVDYRAAAGERNRVTIRRDAAGAEVVWTLHDPGAPIAAGDSCTPVEVHVARCTSRPSPDVPGAFQSLELARVVLGDLDDELVTVEAVAAFGGTGDDRLAGARRLSGDDGDDVLSGSAGRDRLDGGPGADRLFGGGDDDELLGGGGADRLRGEDGDDVLTDGDRKPGPDVLDGGAGGHDSVSYRGRGTSVTVDLADRRRDGARGEADRLSGVEGVRGGSGNDRLSGDEHRNRLTGGPGWDRLTGRSGADELDLGHDGGHASCGPGVDRFPDGVTSLALLDPDCEGIHVLSYEPSTVTAYPRVFDDDRVRFRLTCPEDDLDGESIGVTKCSGTIRLWQRGAEGALLAAGSYPLRYWYRGLVDARLTPLGRQLASRPEGVLATVRLGLRAVPEYDGFDGRTAARWTIRFRLPRPG